PAPAIAPLPLPDALPILLGADAGRAATPHTEFLPPSAAPPPATERASEKRRAREAADAQTPAPPAAEAPAFGSIFETNSVATEQFDAPAPAPSAPPTEFEWNVVAPPEPARPADPSASFADLNAEFTDDAPAPAAVDFST